MDFIKKTRLESVQNAILNVSTATLLKIAHLALPDTFYRKIFVLVNVILDFMLIYKPLPAKNAMKIAKLVSDLQFRNATLAD